MTDTRNLKEFWAEVSWNLTIWDDRKINNNVSIKCSSGNRPWALEWGGTDSELCPDNGIGFGFFYT